MRGDVFYIVILLARINARIQALLRQGEQLKSEKRKREKEGKLKNKTVCFSHAVELDLPLAKKLLSAAFAQAAKVTFRAEECDLYVCYASESGQRLQSVKDRGKTVFTIEDFTKHLGLENE